MKCECGCGADLTRRQARYASDACKSRAWRQRSGYRIPPAAEVCQTRPKRAKSGQSGLQVSYRRAVDVLAAMIDGHVDRMLPPGAARSWADELMREALSDKQRARLDARDGS